MFLTSVLCSLPFAAAIEATSPPSYGEAALQAAFEAFQRATGRSYEDPAERAMRYELWLSHARDAKTLYSWTPYWGLNDTEAEEYRNANIASLALPATSNHPEEPWVAFPDEYVREAMQHGIDWRNHQLVTPAKDQGYHGYCGTFMRVAVAEGQWARVKMNLVALSEQQLVSCVKVSEQYEAIETTGLESEEDYPYNATQYPDASPPPCTQDTSKVVASGYTATTFPPREAGEEQLAAFVYHNGPTGAGIAAEVFNSADVDHWVTNCSSGPIDHAITAVGFGTDASRGPYWIIKNSWGEGWQDEGFVYMPFGVNCGSFPNAKMEMVMMGDTAQYWYGAKYVQLHSRVSEKCMCSNSNLNPALNVCDCNAASTDQQWRFTELKGNLGETDKYVQMRSRYSNRCLVSNTDPGGFRVSPCNIAYDDQHFELIDIDGWNKQVKSRRDGKCLVSNNRSDFRFDNCNSAWTDQHWSVLTVSEDPNPPFLNYV